MPLVMLDFGDYFRKAFKFMIVGAIGAVINWALLYFFVQYLNVWYISAEIVATIIVFGVNFNGNILMKNIKIRKGSEAAKTAPPPLKPEDVVK
jgi:hypothetical protein